MMIPNLMIFGGTLLIAIGGILATKGWHERSVIAHRNGMIRSLAAEWVVNAAVFFDPKFTDTNDANLAKYAVFPRMQTTAITGAIASGLFTGEKDRALLTHITNLSEVLADFNRRLVITEDTMTGNSKDIATWRKKLRDGQTRRSLRPQLAKFAELLISDYGITVDDSFFIKLDSNGDTAPDPQPK